MNISIELPDKVSHRDTYIVNMEQHRKGLKARLEKSWRKYLRRYRPLTIPIRCEFCTHVGEAQWHCHNRDSPQYGLNVQSWGVCSKWSPNQGLLMMLWRAWFHQHRDALPADVCVNLRSEATLGSTQLMDPIIVRGRGQGRRARRQHAGSPPLTIVHRYRRPLSSTGARFTIAGDDSG